MFLIFDGTMGNLDPVKLAEMTKGQLSIIANRGQVSFGHDDVPPLVKLEKKHHFPSFMAIKEGRTMNNA